MQNQKLCLKWNNHMSNMLSLLGSFQQKDMLVDVTISCQGQNIKAHKIILSACSPYFQNIFMENPCQHPIIIINGMKFEDITAILNFMYKGEVNVSHDGLSSFLQAAEALKVKGLAEVCGEKKGTNSISQEVQQSELSRPQRTDTPPRKRPRNRKRSLSDSNRSDDEGLSRKHREPSSPEVHELSGDESFTGDNSSNGPPFNSISRVPQNVYSRSHQSSSNMGGEDDDEYDVESNKMLDTTDSNVSMNNTNTDNNLRIERIMGNATEIESSSMADPESPPDIKPIINFGESSAGPSESGNLMLYNEQSQPGPSNVQDSSLLQHDNSHAQGKRALEVFHKRKRIRKNNVNATQKRSESIDGIELYRCRSCNFSTTSENGIQIHLAKHKERRVLSRSSVRKMGLENEEKETEIHCPACTFSTFDKEEMISHFTGHESQVSCLTEKSGFYQCCHCNFRTKVKLEMENHLLTQANNRRHFINGVTYVPLKSKNCGCSSNISKFQKSSVGPIKSRCVYNCSLCAFYTTSKYEMVKHMEKHYAELEDAAQVFHPHLKMECFQCCHCEFKTTMQSEIENHLLSEEDNKSHLEINLSYPNKFFVCDFCNVKFEDIESLEMHRQYIHIDPIDWQ